MKANTKYVADDGHQFFMCPFTKFEITQGEDTGSHLGTKAVDFASGTVGYKAPYYAPADCKCLWTVPSYGQAIWITLDKVHCPNGYFGYVCFVTCHDNTFNAYSGMVVNQGDQIGNMGDIPKKICSGVHCHFQCNQSSDSTWIINGYGIYMFKNNESYVDDTFYVDDTEIVNPLSGNWRKCKSGSSSSVTLKTVSYESMEDESWAVKFKNDVPITIHKDNSNGASIGTFVKGETQVYTRKGVGNGHRWIGWEEIINGITYKCVCAISGSETRGEDMWVELIDPESIKSIGDNNKDITSTVDYAVNVKGYGVDISEHNGENFDVSKYDFVIIRASYGTNKDKLFETYINKCKEANIPYGVYCYSYALDNEGAKAEGEFILDLIKDKDIALGVWYDMEDADGYKAKNNALTKEKLTSFCKIFCDTVHSKGYYTGVYSTKHWFETLCPTDYPKWIANWGTNDGSIQADFSNYAVMHQYSANPIDKDVIYNDIEFYRSDPLKETENGNDKENDNGNNRSISELIFSIMKFILKWFGKE